MEGFMSSNNTATSKSNKSAGGVFFKVIGTTIVGLAVLGLVLVSVIPNNSGGRNNLIFGTYGDKDIQFLPNNEFGQAVDDEMKRYSSNVDSSNPYFEIVRLMAWQQAFEGVAVNTAIDYHVEHSGYEVSSRAVDRRVVDFGPWRTNGVFDEDRYLSASTANKTAVREQFDEQIAIEAWAADTLEAKHRSSGQLAFLDDMRRTVRTYRMVSIPFTDFPESEVEIYARANAGLFASLPVSRITVSTEEEANEVISAFEEQKSNLTAFADLAIEKSRDSYAESGGEMGSNPRYRIAELIGNESADVVFATAEGNIAGPFDTDYGWMVFHVDGSEEPADLNAGIQEIRTYMLQNEAGIVEENLITMAEKIRIQAITGDGFNQAVQANGYEVITTGAFPVNYGGDTIIGANPENAGIPELSGSTESERFWKEIISLGSEGDVTEPVVMSAAIALFTLDSETVLDTIDYWELLVDAEASRSSEQDFTSAVLGEDNELFKRSFSDAYYTLFPVEG